MFKSLVASLIAFMPAAALAQTMTVTVNGQSFAVQPGTTQTIVTDENGTRVVSTTTQVAAVTMPQAQARPAVYYQQQQGYPQQGYRQAYAPPQPPRLEYADPDADSVQPGIGGARVVRIRRDRFSGHFIVPVVMNGVRIRAIIDTGAMGTILSPEDARATGADKDVKYSRPGVGIGGYTTLYVTKVRNLEIGGQQLGSFAADIGQQGIPQTLLGQPEIAKLGRVVIEDGVMTIYPKGVEMASR